MGHPHYFNPHCAQYDPERAWYFFVMHPEELPEWRRRYQPAEYSNYCDECMILRQHCTNRGGISGRYEHVGCTHCENSNFLCTLHFPSPGYVPTVFDLLGRIPGVQYPDLPHIPGFTPSSTPGPIDDIEELPPDDDDSNNLQDSPDPQWGAVSSHASIASQGNTPPGQPTPPGQSTPLGQPTPPGQPTPLNQPQQPQQPQNPQPGQGGRRGKQLQDLLARVPPPFSPDLSSWTLPNLPEGLPDPASLKPYGRARKCLTCLRRIRGRYSCDCELRGNGMGCTPCSLWGLWCVVGDRALPPRPLTGQEKESAMGKCDCCRENSRTCDRKRPCDSCIIHNEPICRGKWFANCFYRGAPGDNEAPYYQRLYLDPTRGVLDPPDKERGRPQLPADYHTHYVATPDDTDRMLLPFPGQPSASPQDMRSFATQDVSHAVLPRAPTAIPVIPFQSDLFHDIPHAANNSGFLLESQEYIAVWLSVTSALQRAFQILAVDNIREHMVRDAIAGVDGVTSSLLNDIRNFIQDRWRAFRAQVHKEIPIQLPAEAQANLAVVNALNPGNLPIERAAIEPIYRPPSPGSIIPIHTGDRNAMNWNAFGELPAGHPARPDAGLIADPTPPHPNPNPAMANIPLLRHWTNGRLTDHLSMRCLTRMPDGTFCNHPTNTCCEDSTHPHAAQPVCEPCDQEGRNRLAQAFGGEIPFIRAFCCADCCNDIVNNPNLLDNSGTRVWGLGPGFKGAGSEVFPKHPPYTARGGFLGDLLEGTGCACSAKMLDRVLCHPHRFQHLINVTQQRRRIDEWTRSVYGTTMICVACHKNPSIDAYGFQGPRGGEGSQAPTIWQCKSCHDIVVAPPGTNNIPIPVTSLGRLDSNFVANSGNQGGNFNQPQNPNAPGGNTGGNSPTGSQHSQHSQHNQHNQQVPTTPAPPPVDTSLIDPSLLQTTGNTPYQGGSPIQIDTPPQFQGYREGSHISVDTTPRNPVTVRNSAGNVTPTPNSPFRGSTSQQLSQEQLQQLLQQRELEVQRLQQQQLLQQQQQQQQQQVLPSIERGQSIGSLGSQTPFPSTYPELQYGTTPDPYGYLANYVPPGVAPQYASQSPAPQVSWDTKPPQVQGLEPQWITSPAPEAQVQQQQAQAQSPYIAPWSPAPGDPQGLPTNFPAVSRSNLDFKPGQTAIPGGWGAPADAPSPHEGFYPPHQTFGVDPTFSRHDPATPAGQTGSVSQVNVPTPDPRWTAGLTGLSSPAQPGSRSTNKTWFSSLAS